MDNLYRSLKSLSRTLSLRWPQYEKRVVFVLFLFAFFTRFSVNYWVLGIDFVNPGDSRGYETIAQNLLTESTFVDPGGHYAYRPPIYPLFLAVVYGAFGFRNYFALKLIESAIGALTCIMIFLIGKKIWGWPIGLVGGAIAALYPILLFFTGAVLSENLFTFLLMATIYILLQAERHLAQPSWRGKSVYYLIIGGFLLGLSVLTRPYIVLLVPFLFLWAALVYRNRRSALIGGTIVVGVTILTIVPWSIRNYLVFQDIVLITTNGGINFWVGNNSIVAQDSDVRGAGIRPRQLPEAETYFSLSEVERDRLAYRMGVDFLRNNPQSWVSLYLAKLIRFWNILPDQGLRAELLSLFSYGLIFPFFWIGLVVAATYQQKPWLLWLVILVTVLNTLIFYGGVRFRFPIEPLIILFGTLGISRVMQIIDATYRRYRNPAKAHSIMP